MKRSNRTANAVDFEGEIILCEDDLRQRLAEYNVFDEDPDVAAASMWEDMSRLRNLVAKEEAAAKEQRKVQRQARQRFQAKCRRMKARAAEIGLKSWGALQDKSATPADYVAFERVLEESGCLDNILLPVFEEEITGWLIRNPHGGSRLSVYPHDVPELLALSRKDPKRVKILVEMGGTAGGDLRLSHLKGVKSYSNAALLQVRTGENWLKSFNPNFAFRCDFKVLRVLGRTPKRLRWSLIQDLIGPRLPPRKTVTLRHLDWTKYKVARVNPAVRFSTFPPVWQWEQLFGVASQQGLALTPLDGFKVGVFRALCPMMKLDPSKYEMGDLGNAQALFNLVRLFGDEQAIRRFVQAAGFKWTTKGLHDAGQFSLSARRGWTPSKWAPLCLRHPEAVRWSDDFHKLEAVGAFPKSLSEFRKERLKLGYPDIRPGFETLAGVCLDNGLTGEAFLAHQAFWAEVKVKPAEFLPHIQVDGPEVGLPKGWRFTRLQATDYRGPMLGALTGCCQHLKGAGRASAEHGVTSPFSAFYVVTHQGRVIAQSWAWLNRADGIVFDSIESIVRDVQDLRPVFRLFEEASRRMLASSLPIKGVYVGATYSGITRNYVDYLKEKQDMPRPVAHAPVDFGGYYDGSEHILVSGKSPRKQSAVPKLENYTCTKADSTSEHFFHEFLEFMHADEEGAVGWLQRRPELARDWGIPVSRLAQELAQLEPAN